MVIAPQFENVGMFGRNGLAPVQVNGKCGYIDEAGQMVIKPQFDDISYRGYGENGLAKAKINGKWGYIDEAGQMVIAPQFESADSFDTNGLASVKENGKWGYIDEAGQMVIAPQFESAEFFDRNGLAAVKLNGIWGFVNENGKMIVAPRFTNEYTPFFSSVSASVKTERAEKAAAIELCKKKARIVLGMEPDPELAAKRAAKGAAEQARHDAEMQRLQKWLSAMEEKEALHLAAVEEDRASKRAAVERQRQAEAASIEQEEARLAKELSGLGMFAGKRKKEIRTELDALAQKKAASKKRCMTALETIDREAEAKSIELRQDSKQVSLEIAKEEQAFSENMAGLSEKKCFGRYPVQKGGKPEPIEWLILAATESAALIISKYALDCQQYHTSCTVVTWENCSLRRWLNGTFLNAAFSAEEQAKIAKTRVSADKNPEYSTYPGNPTNDKVFLLSIPEVKKYFTSDSAMTCKGTDYCYAQGADKNSNGNCWWWLRSPGSSQYNAASVHDGVNDLGHLVDSSYVAVRPALWIILDP